MTDNRRRAFLWLQRRQHLVLLLVLVTLHLVSAAGPESFTGRWLWLVNVGLFLAWQPFVGGDQRVKGELVAVIFAVVFILVWQFGWGWLSLWYAFLAALVGGKVVMARGARHRWFYLFAFAYLVAAMLVWISPHIIPGDRNFEAQMQPAVHLVAFVLLTAILLALPRIERQRPPELHDFLASLLTFLLLSVLMLGTLSLMGLRSLGYYEALVLTLLGAGGSLLLLSWAWNPKPGFGGLGASLSEYLLRIGLDFDRWLKRQLDLAENEQDAERFLARSIEGFADLPWVAGGEWQSPHGSGSFGEEAKHVTPFSYGGVSMKLFTPYAWTASLVWQASLLLKLVVELYQAKAREHRLRQMEYLQAVHETGARLTHDIKNLLQSIEVLCYAVENTVPADAQRLAELIRRQLPALGLRLRSTLEKLQKPQLADDTRVAAEVWWEALQRRFAAPCIEFERDPATDSARLPLSLFDSVADNLLTNVAYKRQLDPGLRVRCMLGLGVDGEIVFSVSDSGAAVRAELLPTLFEVPLPSAAGLGIGLYQAARQSREAGYEIRLASNRDGAVRFELTGPGR